MAWKVRFSDEAWEQYANLSGPVQDQLRKLLFVEWVANGPQADGVRLINGVIFREADFAFGLRLSWLMIADDDVLLAKIRPLNS